MKPSLLPHLRCPITGAPLTHQGPTAADEIREGALLAPDGTRYPVERGVPYLLDPAQFKPGQAETVDSFSSKWQLARNYRTQTREHYVAWYLERYGFGDINGLARFLQDKTRILDAGTGHGRDAEMYATTAPHAQVFGIDISTGIHNAHDDLGHLPNLNLVRADLTRLPFPPEFFDFIACDQVIHHTPDTRESFQRLLPFLAKDGHIAIYVYKKKGPVREFCDDYIRERTVPMSVEQCMAFSEAMTHLGRALAELKTRVYLPVEIPILEIPAGWHDVQRLIYWHMCKCYWNDTMDWEANVITNFDWYHPLHAHRHTPDEVRGWFEQAGLEVVHFHVMESGISVLGRKG